MTAATEATQDKAKKAAAVAWFTRELDTLKAEMAATQDALMGPRMMWRGAQDRLASACLRLDVDAQRVISWRPPSPEEVVKLDAARRRFLADAGPFLDAERILKGAIREAEINLKAAQKGRLSLPEKFAPLENFSGAPVAQNPAPLLKIRPYYVGGGSLAQERATVTCAVAQPQHVSPPPTVAEGGGFSGTSNQANPEEEAAQMTQPQRHKKHDRLMHSEATRAEVECDLATGPFDRICREMDRKWGQDRLPDLVSAETAARWGTALANLNAAIDARDPAMVVARVNACLRGFAAMDAEATAAGHQPIVPEAWEFQLDGKTCAVLRDDAAWPAYAEARPDVRIYTMREVANALAAYGQTVAAIKDAFPGAEVKAVRSPLAQALEDEIPFAPEFR